MSSAIATINWRMAVLPLFLLSPDQVEMIVNSKETNGGFKGARGKYEISE